MDFFCKKLEMKKIKKKTTEKHTHTHTHAARAHAAGGGETREREREAGEARPPPLSFSISPRRRCRVGRFFRFPVGLGRRRHLLDGLVDSHHPALVFEHRQNCIGGGLGGVRQLGKGRGVGLDGRHLGHDLLIAHALGLVFGPLIAARVGLGGVIAKIMVLAGLINGVNGGARPKVWTTPPPCFFFFLPGPARGRWAVRGAGTHAGWWWGEALVKVGEGSGARPRFFVFMCHLARPSQPRPRACLTHTPHRTHRTPRWTGPGRGRGRPGRPGGRGKRERAWWWVFFFA